MKPHEPKNRDNKGEKEGGRRAIKKIDKRRKGNKTLSLKERKGAEKKEKNFDKKAIKEKEPKIKVLAPNSKTKKEHLYMYSPQL
jgi:hypothetical protein